MNKSKTITNVIFSLILQVCTLASGFIIPKLVLCYFGSEVNGLVSSINQFLNYISILEGGFTGIIMANLYSPILKNDIRKISSIIKTADKFYKNIAFVFILYSIILGITYKFIFNANFSWEFILTLCLILSLNLFLLYCFTLTYKTLLISSQMGYIVSIVQSILLLLGIFFSYISIKLYPNVLILKLAGVLPYFIQPFILKIFVNKNFKLIENVEEDLDVKKNRWSGFAVNMAAFIHLSTDIVILSFFETLSNISVYSVYLLVITGLRSIFSSIINSVAPKLGYIYATNDKNKLEAFYNKYEIIMFFLIFWIFSVTIQLISPFVRLYTFGITDVNYYRPFLGYILVITEVFYLIKEPLISLSYVANKYKDITIYSFIEALINIILSILMVKSYGMIGVIFGTLIAMIYRMITQVRYMESHIISRRKSVFYKKLIIYSITFIFCFIFGISVLKVPNGLLSWIIYALLYSCIYALIYIFITLLFYKKDMQELILLLKLKLQKNDNIKNN